MMALFLLKILQLTVLVEGLDLSLEAQMTLIRELKTLLMHKLVVALKYYSSSEEMMM